LLSILNSRLFLIFLFIFFLSFFEVNSKAQNQFLCGGTHSILQIYDQVGKFATKRAGGP